MSQVQITNETVTLYLLKVGTQLYLPKFGEDMEDCHFQDGMPLLIVYPEGDCDTFSDWMTKEQKGKIAMALFDAREMGHIPSACRFIVFPGESEPWEFDLHVGDFTMPSMKGIWY